MNLFFSKVIIKLRSEFRKNKLLQQSKTSEKGCLGQAKDLEALKKFNLYAKDFILLLFMQTLCNEGMQV